MMRFYITATTIIGSVTNNGGTGVLYNVTSDKRLKNDLGAIKSSYIFDHVKAHAFSWKSTGQKDAGFFAQDVYPYVPRAVLVGKGKPGDKKFEPWEMDYSKMVPILWAEVQKQRGEIAELKAAVRALQISLKTTRH